MSDLLLDLARLSELRDDLQSLIDEFKGAEDFSNSIADATGHDQLASEVHDFAGKWNTKRKQMADDIQALHDQLKAVTDGFTQVDQGLARALDPSQQTSSKDDLT